MTSIRRSLTGFTFAALGLLAAALPGAPARPAHAAAYLVTTLADSGPGISNDGCLVGDLRDGPWSSHTIDTSAWSGQPGRVEFRQHTNVVGKGFSTLVDDVVVVP